jgi:2-iminobutanoate/2-iminopropanoate deaminase
MKKVIVPENVHRPFGYAHAIQIDKTLYVSGQIPLDQEMNVVGKGDMAAQTEQAYENLKRVLETAGAPVKRDVH